MRRLPGGGGFQPQISQQHRAAVVYHGWKLFPPGVTQLNQIPALGFQHFCLQPYPSNGRKPNPTPSYLIIFNLSRFSAYFPEHPGEHPIGLNFAH